MASENYKLKTRAYKNASFVFLLIYVMTVIVNDMFVGFEGLDYKFILSFALLSMVITYFVTIFTGKVKET